ncbi:pirin family protein [Corallincola platygyrae]|uniref:Pirin family protein n=1 Tax=Corallincola platygyrae TaxID=1193278 RepID=A0ABW4XKF6_9GAMM
MLTLRKASERGHINLGWLDSHHSFSFGHYYDPAHMGVSVLRVINQDIVQPNAGFDTHPHQDMEILSYVLSGKLAHKDSMGHMQEIPVGEFQLMSAGTGVTHSEYNGAEGQTTEFLQIWIRPDTKGLTPSYQQQAFDGKGLVKVVSPDGSDSSLKIHQDVSVYRGRFEADEQIDLPKTVGRQGYLQLVSGEVAVNGITLTAGDGVAVATDEGLVTLSSISASEWLWFDLP